MTEDPPYTDFAELELRAIASMFDESRLAPNPHQFEIQYDFLAADPYNTRTARVRYAMPPQRPRTRGDGFTLRLPDEPVEHYTTTKPLSKRAKRRLRGKK